MLLGLEITSAFFCTSNPITAELLQLHYSVRELDRQISASLFERTLLGNATTSTALKELNHNLSNTFKDSYVFEFLNLSEPHSESDLQKGLTKQMKISVLNWVRILYLLGGS